MKVKSPWEGSKLMKGRCLYRRKRASLFIRAHVRRLVIRWSQIVGVNVEQWPDLRVRWLSDLTMTSLEFANEWRRKLNRMAIGQRDPKKN